MIPPLPGLHPSTPNKSSYLKRPRQPFPLRVPLRHPHRYVALARVRQTELACDRGPRPPHPSPHALVRRHTFIGSGGDVAGLDRVPARRLCLHQDGAALRPGSARTSVPGAGASRPLEAGGEFRHGEIPLPLPSSVDRSRTPPNGAPAPTPDAGASAVVGGGPILIAGPPSCPAPRPHAAMPAPPVRSLATRRFDPDAALLTSDAGVPHTATELTARAFVRSRPMRTRLSASPNAGRWPPDFPHRHPCAAARRHTYCPPGGDRPKERPMTVQSKGRAEQPVEP